VVLGLGALALLAFIPYVEFGSPFKKKDKNPTNSTEPTPSTSPPQPATPPREFSGRALDRRGLSVDTSSELYPKPYLHGAADSVVTTVGNSEARPISDNDNQKM
jgi:hypothetical protein